MYVCCVGCTCMCVDLCVHYVVYPSLHFKSFLVSNTLDDQDHFPDP